MLPLFDSGETRSLKVSTNIATAVMFMLLLGLFKLTFIPLNPCGFKVVTNLAAEDVWNC